MTDDGGTFEGAAEELAKRVAESVEECVRGRSRVAVAFSGGVDSSVIAVCAKRLTDAFACSASVPGSFDAGRAASAAREIGLEIVEARVTADDARSAFRDLELPFEPTPMDRELWCLYRLASERAKRAGAEAILLGQLSDELFGGYAKYERALGLGEAEVAEMMSADVAAFYARGMLRDVSACERWLAPRFPFASERVVELGASIPVGYKVREGVRKAVLRRAAVVLGVPEKLAAAPKKAAQYSSGIQKLVRDHAL